MPTESSLRRSGRWTSFITRQTNRLKSELLAELGGVPTGAKRVLLEMALKKYGVLLVLERETRKRPLVKEDGTAASLIDRNVLAWQSSLERTLGLLLDQREDEIPPGILEGIDPRFKSKREDEQAR